MKEPVTGGSYATIWATKKLHGRRKKMQFESQMLWHQLKQMGIKWTARPHICIICVQNELSQDIKVIVNVPSRERRKSCQNRWKDHPGVWRAGCLQNVSKNACRKKKNQKITLFVAQLYWDMIDVQHCISVRCCLQWFDTCIHNSNSILALANPTTLSHNYQFFSWWDCLKPTLLATSTRILQMLQYL